MGWANRRTPFGRPRYAHVSDSVRAHLRKGVGWSALHSFGCTARQVRYAESKYKTILLNETFLLLNETNLLLIFTQ
jgi:hypothetical protein